MNSSYPGCHRNWGLRHGLRKKEIRGKRKHGTIASLPKFFRGLCLLSVACALIAKYIVPIYQFAECMYVPRSRQHGFRFPQNVHTFGTSLSPEWWASCFSPARKQTSDYLCAYIHSTTVILTYPSTIYVVHDSNTRSLVQGRSMYIGEPKRGHVTKSKMIDSLGFADVMRTVLVEPITTTLHSVHD